MFLELFAQFFNMLLWPDPRAGYCIDHAVKLEELLKNGDRFRRLIIPASLKQELCAVLQEKHGIWRGSLFPDSAGAAETAGMALKNSV